MNTTTPQEAQTQLTEARLRTQGISGFSPVWVAYEIILIAMTFGVLCAYFDGHPDFQSLRTPFFAMGMAWLFGGIVMLILTKTISKPIRFGFERPCHHLRLPALGHCSPCMGGDHCAQPLQKRPIKSTFL